MYSGKASVATDLMEIKFPGSQTKSATTSELCRQFMHIKCRCEIQIEPSAELTKQINSKKGID